MTHRHAQRRGVVARPSEAHLRMLARLIKRAEVAALDCTDKAKALSLTQEAERVARKAVLPVGHQNDADSPVVRLIRLGKAWHGMDVHERRSAPLRDLAIHAREVVDAALLGLSAPALSRGGGDA